MSLTKIDKAISVAQYYIKRERKFIDGLERKVQPTERDKIEIGNKLEFIQSIELLMKETTSTLKMNLGKLPPQATDLEASILGALMLEAAAIDNVVGFLKPEHFYLQPNVIIYKCILFQKEKGFPIDMRTVCAQLRRRGQLELVGGATYIAELTSKVSSSANIEYHARIMMQYAIKRELIRMASDLMTDGYEDETDCFDMLGKAETQLKEIQEWTK